MNNSEKFCCNSSFTDEVSTPVKLERWKDTDISLLMTTYADNKYLFGGKGTKKDVFEKIAEAKASGGLVKRQRGACERMGLVTKWNALFPNGNFPVFFCKWKTPKWNTNFFWNSGKSEKKEIPRKILPFFRDEPFYLNSPRNYRKFHSNGKRSQLPPSSTVT